MNTFDFTGHRNISPTSLASSEAVIVKNGEYYSKKGIIIPRECQSFKHELHDMDDFKWKLLWAFMNPDIYDKSSKRFQESIVDIIWSVPLSSGGMFHGHKGNSMKKVRASGIVPKEGSWGFFTSKYDYALHDYALDRPDCVISARLRKGTKFIQPESISPLWIGRNYESDYYLINRLSYGTIQAIVIDRGNMMGVVTQIFDPGCVEYEDSSVQPNYLPSKSECDAIFVEFEAYAEIIERNPVLKAYL